MAKARYRIRVLPGQHQLDCSLELQGLPAGSLRLACPTWVPGAYSPMKYGRDVFDVRAFEGERALEVVREGWSGFRVEGVGASARVTWRAQACDAGWGELIGLVDPQHAVLRATVYLFSPDHAGPCSVHYELPEGWALHHPAASTQQEDGRFDYPSFHALLETCVACGQFERITRELDGVRFHHLFLDGAVGSDTEAPRFVDALMKLAAKTREVFGSFPFRDYTYLFSHDPNAEWGLEHPDGTMIGLGEALYVSPKAWNAGIRVCAHELFHAWNVCRLKPRALATANPVDPPNPDSLWLAEGFTRYYEFLLGARIGEVSAEQLFSNVLNYHRHLSALPAYAHVSPRDSSRAAFLNHSRYPGSVNASIDYYDAGMLIAFVLDARLRAQGDSLDARLARFYAAHGADPQGYTHAQVLDELGDGEGFRREVEQAGALSTLGQMEALGFALVRKQVPYLGLVLAKDNAGPAIAHVLDDSPAAQAGLAPGDVIERIGGHPFALEALNWLIGRRPQVNLQVLRGHRSLAFCVKTGRREDAIGLRWEGTEAQRRMIGTWLNQPPPEWKSGESLPSDRYDNFHGVRRVI